MKSKLLYNLLAVILFAGVGYAAADMWQPPRHDNTMIGTGTEDDPIGVNFDTVASVAYVDSVAGEGGGGASYLVYTALLTQTGTDAPTAIVLENTLGFTPTWVYNSDGNYYAVIDDGNILNDLYVVFGFTRYYGNNSINIGYTALGFGDEDPPLGTYVNILTAEAKLNDTEDLIFSNNMLNKYPIEIRIYQ